MTIEAEQEDCLVEGLNHLFDFHVAEAGHCYFKCRFCPEITFEIEDSTP